MISAIDYQRRAIEKLGNELSKAIEDNLLSGRIPNYRISASEKLCELFIKVS